MADFVIVDTDVLIDAARDIVEAKNCLQQIEQRATLAVSAITQMELFVGCENKAELQKVEQFLSRFQIIALNERISEQAVELLRKYRLSHGLLIPDALIAATAIFFGVPLSTKNQKDYRFMIELMLLPYPKPF